jgi:iron(II)-dependent oxidoreductase
VEVPEFRIGAYPITNGEFLRFVRAGGYHNSELWEAESWTWKESRGLEHPLYWARRGNEWKYRGMFEEAPLALDCPVYVSHAEASAFCKWAGKSLPTEAQWHRAAYGAEDGSPERLYPWGDSAPDASRGNFDCEHWDATPVSAHPASASAFGAEDLLGNGWEWTSTLFGPFPGFEPFPFYRGYSADFFDGRHWVMKGGSARTAACFLRRPFRNWFQPNYPYMYATFRCVEE